MPVAKKAHLASRATTAGCTSATETFTYTHAISGRGPVSAENRRIAGGSVITDPAPTPAR